MNINAAVERIFGAVLEATALASILIVLVAVVQWLAGKRLGPSWRFALWGIVLVRLLVPIAPESRWSVFNAAQWLANGKAAPVMTMQVERETLVVAEVTGEAVEVRFPTEAPVFGSAAEARRPLPWRTIGMAVWGVGVVWFLGSLLVGSWWLRRQIRKEAREGDGDAQKNVLDAALRVAAAEMEVRGVFRIVETGRVSSPALFGMLRPQLLVARGFAEQLNAQELRHVLLHELAHLKRWDLITNWVMAVAQAVHWFNPLVWLALRQMRVERELACDEMVLRVTSEAGEDGARAYGQTILRLLEGVKSRPSLPALVGIAEEKYSARKRILQIAGFDSRGPRRRMLGVLLVLAVTVGGLTNAQIRIAEGKDEQSVGDTGAERPTPVQTKGAEKKLAEKLDELMFPEGSLEGKTVAEAVELLQRAYPEELREVRFIWRQATNLTSVPGVTLYSINAIGYINSPIAESAARELKLARANLANNPIKWLPGETLEVRNRSALSVLELMTRGVDRAVMLEFEGKDKVVFNEHDQTAATRLIREARLLLEMGRLDEAEAKLQEVLRADPERRAAIYYLKLVEERRVAQEDRKREEMLQSQLEFLPFGQRRTEILPSADRPPNPYARTNRVYAGKARQEIIRKLNEMVIDHYEVPNGLELSEVIKDIYRLARKLDPEKVGVNFLVSGRLHNPRVEETGTGFEPLAGRPKVPLEAARYVVKISPPLRNVTLLGLIHTIVEVAKPPAGYEGAPSLRFSVEEYAIVFGQKPREGEQLTTRSFKIDPNTFIQGLRPVGDVSEVLQESGSDRSARIQEGVRDFFTSAGIDFGETGQANGYAGGGNAKKAIFFNDRTGILMVRGTPADVQVVENALHRMNDAIPKQIALTVDMVEVKNRAEFDKLFGASMDEPARNLSNPRNFETALTTLEIQSIEKGAANGGFFWRKLPRVSTTVGRATRIVEEKLVSVDVLCEFEGNEQTFKVTASSSDSKNGTFEAQEGAVFDGQTMVLLPKVEGDSVKPGRVIFITPRLIDPAGNPINTDDLFIKQIQIEKPKR